MHASTTPARRKIAIHLHNRQKRYPVRLKKLQKLIEPLPLLLKKDWPPDVPEVDVVFVTPADSSRVHAEFFNDSSSTDVMTFMHGELIICPAVADKQKKMEGLSLENELLTYIIHGILHLCGWNDLTDRDFEAMRKKQTQIREKLLASA